MCIKTPHSLSVWCKLWGIPFQLLMKNHHIWELKYGLCGNRMICQTEVSRCTIVAEAMQIVEQTE